MGSFSLFDILGFGGLVFLAICWIPQTIATIKTGYVSVKLSFLTLYLFGSLLLFFQAIGLNNIPLMLLNGYTALSSSINLFYGLFPRVKAETNR
ncbi:MAG: hypothetical protein PHP42_13045 [Bacteroidota bacterium]|nr:hypothetical protein [Bacteroidota bacterium]